jgi:hypothetical protein
VTAAIASAMIVVASFGCPAHQRSLPQMDETTRWMPQFSAHCLKFHETGQPR